MDLLEVPVVSALPWAGGLIPFPGGTGSRSFRHQHRAAGGVSAALISCPESDDRGCVPVPGNILLCALGLRTELLSTTQNPIVIVSYWGI